MRVNATLCLYQVDREVQIHDFNPYLHISNLREITEIALPP